MDKIKTKLILFFKENKKEIFSLCFSVLKNMALKIISDWS